MKNSLFVLMLLFVFAACGNEPEATPTATVPQSQPQSMIKKAPVAEEGVLLLKTGDDMKYDKTTLRAKAGEEVTLKLVHTGKMGIDVMGHNFVLLEQGTDVDALATEALNHKATDYIPPSDNIIAHTKLIGGGESASVTFTAPTEPGSYTYICTFPAHYTVMRGELIVE